MPAPTISIELLTYTLTEWQRHSLAPVSDLVTVDFTVESPPAALGEARRTPDVELRDEQRRVHPLASEEGWTDPLQPDTAARARLRFEVPEDATGLECVLAPGTDDEVAIQLAT